MPNFKPEKLRVNLRLCINRLKLLEKKKSEYTIHCMLIGHTFVYLIVSFIPSCIIANILVYLKVLEDKISMCITTTATRYLKVGYVCRELLLFTGL